MKTRINRLLSYVTTVNIEKRTGENLPMLEVNIQNGKYVLDGEKVNYSYGALHDLFKASFKKYRIDEKSIKNVLILGFGAGSVASILTNEFKMNCKIKGVEKDPVVIQFAKKYFNSDNLKDTKIECADAFSYISKDEAFYDLIVIDIFVEDRVPMTFLMKEFISMVKQRLRTGGSVFFNKINDNEFQVDETNRLIQTMTNEFNGNIETFSFSKSGVSNCMLVYQDNKWQSSIQMNYSTI